MTVMVMMSYANHFPVPSYSHLRLHIFGEQVREDGNIKKTIKAGE